MLGVYKMSLLSCCHSDKYNKGPFFPVISAIAIQVKSLGILTLSGLMES